MGSRRGRLNWSNLDVHISDDVIEKQHQFNVLNEDSLTLVDNVAEHEKESSSPVASGKPSWKPKMGVGEMNAEQFIGNFMLTGISRIKLNIFF